MGTKAEDLSRLEARENHQKKQRLTKLRSHVEGDFIYRYVSYRELLKDLYEVNKTTRNSYSYELFAADLGFPQTNCIRLVVSAKRKLMPRAKTIISKTLKLNRDQANYLGFLVKYNNASRPDQREHYFAKLVEYQKNYLFTENETQKNELEYFAQWYHAIIREMTNLDEFKHDTEWIENKLLPKVSTKQIEESLHILEQLKLIVRNSKTGEIQNSNEHVRTDRKIDKLSHINFQQKMCDLAKDAITNVPAEKREFNTVAVSLDMESVMVLAKKINQLIDAAFELEDKCKNKTHVYNLNLQLFPFTKD